MITSLYETDFHAWTQHQAELLRQEEFAELDLHHLIEEIESLGKSQQNEVKSRLRVLIMHLLKWQIQPLRRSASWRYTINVQRLDLQDLLDENPSLRARLAEFVEYAYPRAIRDAVKQTGLAATAFPASLPYTAEQILDENFWPEPEED
ncbi:MAG: DUF29 domain-containing protein [Caldilineaceae bacterium]|nr:DUF29 domain-containing protein [Caldilineaceae bacterium]